jgi:hypothetical protein
MACDFGRRRAVIQVPDGGPPRDSASVYHELLHLKRYFVDGIPKLVYCDDAHEFESDADARLPQLFERLDNQIEHLFIVPHELARYRGARDATGQGGSTPCSGIPGSRMTVSSWCGHSFVGSWETISWLTPHRRVS